MQEEKSIFMCIGDNIKNGALPEEFELPAEEDEWSRHGISMVDGCLDGMMVYGERVAPPFDKRAKKNIKAAMEAVNREDFDRADYLLTKVVRKHRALGIVDKLAGYVARHFDEFDEHEIYHYAFMRMCASGNKELVKVGMELIRVLNGLGVPQRLNEEVDGFYRVLGLSDEFTLFAVRFFCGNNAEIFNLARRVRGWGRIHAVRYLEPETQEMKEWLLYCGWRNDIYRGYSAGECFIKAEVAKLLRQKMSEDELIAAGGILEAMLDTNGPIDYLSVWEGLEDDLLAYMEQSQRIGVVHRECLRAMAETAQRENLTRLYAKLCEMAGI